MNERFRDISELLPEIKKPRRFKPHGPVFRYKKNGCVFCSPVIDLLQKDEGFPSTDPVDPEELLKEINDLTIRYSKGAPIKRRKYW